MADFFYWTGDADSTNEPAWIVAALEDGAVRIENGGTPAVRLVIGDLRYPRFSLISRAEVEAVRHRGRGPSNSPSAGS